MKKTLYLLLLSCITIILISCGTQKSAAQLAAEKQILTEQIETGKFKFVANYVIPMGNFQPRYLTSSYDVKVTSDTVYSHLPYFGVAYEAPWNPSESPLIFNSTKFDYSYAPGNRAGSWIVNIHMYDKIRPMTYIFTIWENGKADMVVWDSSRQSISFRGDIEINLPDSMILGK